MGHKESVVEFKDRLMSSLEAWAESRIDDFSANNPRMAIASVYMKRGVKNYLNRESDRIGNMINDAALFLCDESGHIDTEMLFDDLMSVFKEMEEIPFGKGFIRGTLGKGVIRFQLPDNPITGILFGESQSIKITSRDFLELKEILTTEI